MIKPDIVALEKSTSKNKDKRNNISNILSNLKWIYNGVYLHYDNLPRLKFEKSIAEETKLRRQSFDEIPKKEKIISPELFDKYFGYSSPGDMHKALNEKTRLK